MNYFFNKQVRDTRTASFGEFKRCSQFRNIRCTLTLIGIVIFSVYLKYKPVVQNTIQVSNEKPTSDNNGNNKLLRQGLLG